MKTMLALFLALALALSSAAPALAQPDTLEKIKSSGALTIGTRTGSPPFAYINKSNEWVGFSIDLVDVLIKPEIEKAVGKSIKIEKKESTPQTRIPLLTSNSVDLIAETMTDTSQRREQVDFSLTFFYTGAQFLVKKGSPILVEGRLRMDTWDDKQTNQKRTKILVTAENVRFLGSGQSREGGAPVAARAKQPAAALAAAPEAVEEPPPEDDVPF